MLKCVGFEPFFDKNSKILILGSFPSVKSRKEGFYYGNRQNRFWRTLAEFFGEPVPQTVEEKKQLLKLKNVALWDIVTECEIVGSQDAAIKNYEVVDLKKVLQNSKIGLIILNGSKAYEIFSKYYNNLEIPSVKLPSTSPANTFFTKEKWFDALSHVFGRAE